MKLKFIKETTKNSQVSDKYLTNIENKLSVKIPQSLKDFYKEYDGAKNKLCVFNIENFIYEINEFIWIKTNKHFFVSLIKNNRIDGFIPDEYIPFAMDRGGAVFYINNKDGKIYFISGDNIDDPTKIADSLEELFEIMNSSIEE